MKLSMFIPATLTIALMMAACASNKENTAGNHVYKGKLQVKALCMNYTLSVTEGDIDTNLVVASWTDETTGKSYPKAFALADPCSFPAGIKEGDEFQFIMDTAKRGDCAVCMAYYPTPGKKLSIKVVEK